MSTKKTKGLREGKDRDYVLFMSDVSVLYKSCVVLYIWLKIDHFICWI